MSLYITVSKSGVRILCQKLGSETGVKIWCHNQMLQSDDTSLCQNHCLTLVSQAGFRVSRHTLASKPFAFACNKFSSYFAVRYSSFMQSLAGCKWHLVSQSFAMINASCHNQCQLLHCLTLCFPHSLIGVRGSIR